MNVRANQLHGVEVEWTRGPKGWEMKEIPGTEFTMPVDLVLLAMGFLHVVHGGLIESLGLKLDQRGDVVVDDYMTSEEGVFAAGDTTLGASLVVPFHNKSLILGTWQQIVVVDFDNRARSRQVVLQIMGE